jgi:polyhydroxyalkanoate synthesis regulator phasin
MKELLKKGLLVGMGAAEFTRETLAKAIAELEKKGEVTKAEAKKIMESFSRAAQQRRKEFESSMEKGFSSLLGKMHLATSDKLEELEKRLRNLEKKSKAKK